MNATLVAVIGLTFTVFVATCGGIVAALKMTFTFGKMANRLDNLENKPNDSGDCAKQLGIMNERLTGFEQLFDEKINSLRDLIHEGLKPKPHLRAVPKERSRAGS